MPTTCEFKFFENPAGIYYSGQLLSGHVELRIENAKTVRGIYIKIIGTGYCHWTTGSGKNKKSYTGEETYLNEKTYFVGSQFGEITVQPGFYTYTFQCNLPPQLPTSLEGDIGHIRYMASVTLDRPMWPDQTFETTFTVIKPLNLNDELSYRQPVHGKKVKTFYLCCLLFCCQSDPLVIVGRIPVGGYTPGQTINLEFTADNGSDQDVVDFETQLIKKIEYRSNSGRTREEVVVITQKIADGCPISKFNSYRTNLEVSPVPPTDFLTSNVCKVRYFIRVVGTVSGCHNNAILEMPITIGTYPILDNLIANPLPGSAPHTDSASAPLLPLADNVITNQPTPPVQPSAPPPYPQQDPPSYEDAIQAGENFKPKYPVYRRATSYSSNS